LAAGIGGMRLAFEKAGGKCIFSSEIDSYPARMYESNFRERPSGDITKIPSELIPKHDVLVAGFPCQPFSLAGVSKRESMGRNHGFMCETKGTLFFDVARIIKDLRPKMFLLENVKNLKSHDRGKTFATIMKILSQELGYNISEKIINSAELVPQNRERIYIIGSLDSQNKFEFPSIKKKKNNCLGNILDVDVHSKYTLTKGTWESLKRHAKYHKLKGNGFGYGLCDETSVSRTLSARYYKDGAEILVKQKNKRPRRLTPRECARLMGFPNSYDISSLSDARAYKSFGNSVVVPVVHILAKEISKNLKSKNMTNYISSPF
tara:strand:- start:2714 stop:3673 length:960 start_codon:yes stop_codon:yes gene_type:complete